MVTIKLNDEAISKIGCNIATGIIVETLENFKQSDPKGEISKIKTIFINGFTLYRNLVNCLDGRTRDKVVILKNELGVVRVRKLFVEDTIRFLQVLEELGYDVKIFIPTYKTLKDKYNNWIDEESLNPLKSLLTKTQDKALASLKTVVPGIIRNIDYKFPKTDNALVITHLGFDLLNYVNNKNIILAESHTGEFKKKDKWFTKLHKLGKNDLSILPFNEIIYRLFGDNWYVKPESINLRKYIYKIALRRSWYFDIDNKGVLNVIKQEDISLYNEIKNLIKPVY